MEVITHGGGEILFYIFNGVAMITTGDSFADLILISLTFATIWIGFKTAFNLSSKKENAIWFAAYLIFYQGLMLPKTTVTITDKFNPTYFAQVDNVPYGLAVLAGYTSAIGNGITELFDQSFALPDDMSYGTTGFLFGSEVVRDATRIKISDDEFSNNMNEFIQQCVFSDINASQKYTFGELKKTEDIWTFVTADNAQSQVRMFGYETDGQEELVTCLAGSVLLQNRWEEEIQDQLVYLYRRKYGSNNTDDAIAASIMEGYLQSSTTFLMDMSQQATETIKQNLLINAINTASNDLSEYADIIAVLETRNSFSRSASQATHWIPLMRTALEAMLYGIFPFMFLIFLLPVGLKAFMSYIQSLLWLQAWSPLYAILHLIVSLVHKTDLEFNGGVSNIQNMNDISEVHDDITIVAGFLMLSIPFLAIKLLQGLSSIGHMLGSMLAVPQGAASMAAGEMTRGNYSSGNSSFENHSFENVSGNKFDTREVDQQHGSTIQQPDGSKITYQGDGSVRYDNAEKMSNFKRNLSSHMSQSEAYQERAGYSQAMGENMESRAQSSLSSSFDTASRMSQHYNEAKDSSESWVQGVDSNTRQAFENVSSLSDQWGANAAVSANAEAKVQGGFEIAGTGATASAGGAVSIGGNYNLSKGDQENLSNSLDIINKSSQEGRFNMTDSEGRSLNKDLNSSYGEYKSFSKDASRYYNQSENLSKEASISKESGMSMTTNETQDFYQWVQNKGYSPQEAASIIEDSDRIQTLSQYSNTYMQEKVEDGYSNKYGADLINNIHVGDKEYLDYAESFDQKHSSSVINQNDKIDDRYQEGSLKTIDNSGLSQKVDKQHANIKNNISQKDLSSDKLEDMEGRFKNNTMLNKLKEKDD